MSAEPAEGDYQLTANQLAAFKEAFEIFDKQKLGVINYSQLCALLRSVGQNPTEAEIESIVEEWDPDGIQHFDLDTFLRICESDHFKDPMKEEVLMEAFRAFDPDGRGLIRVEELRRVLQVLGEKMEGEAADVFIDFAVSKCDPGKTGEINYEVLTQELLERDPKVAYA
ncbi:calmodulin, putative [Perkinsus marinus ATCC 50983]|uniref:Calmodulin n=1 Tax=Perkinsus marinus (strain ATCC 50983 / TXsc) TaxID=423536 RepID=C5KAW4_PERM5|nr:calmodulin, putative [Perkinsus marinus ATCC 50983]EER18290.1 calmodulin, putative [Perkinsus marinus ATCC 50983]|eukprot:XP_002786494.1 calmodulin, putative [Perkinsus marinus ATCC 50983]